MGHKNKILLTCRTLRNCLRMSHQDAQHNAQRRYRHKFSNQTMICGPYTAGARQM